jgi:hypothetical protein
MPKVKEKQWTVMVYLAGDNNLESAGVIDLNEMKRAGSSDQVNVIAQFDRQGKNIATKRYYIRKAGTLAKDVVGSLGETNMGDPHVLEDFIQWGAKNYPPSIASLSYGTMATAGTMRMFIGLQETP